MVVVRADRESSLTLVLRKRPTVALGARQDKALSYLIRPTVTDATDSIDESITKSMTSVYMLFIAEWATLLSFRVTRDISITARGKLTNAIGTT